MQRVLCTGPGVQCVGHGSVVQGPGGTLAPEPGALGPLWAFPPRKTFLSLCSDEIYRKQRRG